MQAPYKLGYLFASFIQPPPTKAKDCVLSTEGTLVVTVSDVNDNPPIFTEKGLYTADLPSSSNPGYNVKQVAAMDADDGLNGQVRYSLQEPASIVRGTFNIDSESGRQCSTIQQLRDKMPLILNPHLLPAFTFLHQFLSFFPFFLPSPPLPFHALTFLFLHSTHCHLSSRPDHAHWFCAAV